MRNGGLLLLIVSLTLLAGCSKSERKRVKNALDDIHDFHVEVAKTAVSAGAFATAFAASSRNDDHDDEPQRPPRNYVVSPAEKKATEDKERILYFIQGYYANDANRLTFPFDVTVRDFKILVFDEIIVQWWVTIPTADAEVVFTGMAAEKDRLRNALGERGYDYPKGIMMTVDILGADGSRLQSSYRVRW